MTNSAVVDLTFVDDSDSDSDSDTNVERSKGTKSSPSFRKQEASFPLSASVPRKASRKRSLSSDTNKEDKSPGPKHNQDGKKGKAKKAPKSDANSTSSPESNSVVPIACLSEGQAEDKQEQPVNTPAKKQKAATSSADNIIVHPAEEEQTLPHENDTTTADNTTAFSPTKLTAIPGNNVNKESQGSLRIPKPLPSEKVAPEENKTKINQLEARSTNRNFPTTLERGDFGVEPPVITPEHAATEHKNSEELDPRNAETMDSNLTIKTAFLGNVSVGKSTLLNVVLGDRYNPTSMKRSTAGVREFHLMPHCLCRKRKALDNADDALKNGARESERQPAATGESADDNTVVQRIREQIHQDNEKQRSQSDKLDSSMVFPIEIPRGFFGEQRDDVTLALVDVPGLNETKQDLYCQWVKDNWNSFDCAVVVLDAKQDCQTQDVGYLLDVVKTCLTGMRKIPVIFVINKVDNISNKSLCAMVEQIKSDVKSIFEGVLEVQSYEIGHQGEVNPIQPENAAILAISAQYALLFEHAKRGCSNPYNSSKGLESFMKADVDFDLIEQFGLDEVGKSKWNRLATKEEKFERVYNELQDPRTLQDRIRDANFKLFEKILKATVCGKERQTDLLELQLDCKVQDAVSCDQMYKRLTEIHKMAQLLGREDNVTKFFWKTYKAVERDSHERVQECVEAKPLAAPAYLLQMYFKFLTESKLSGRESEIEKTRQVFEELVHLQVDLVLKKFALNWKDPPIRSFPPPGCLTWENMTPDLWSDIFDSMLLAADGREFKKIFGLEIVAISRVIRTISSYTKPATCFKAMTDIGITRSVTDDCHWGHVIYSYCEFNDLIKQQL